jgi:hypothetical protein
MSATIPEKIITKKENMYEATSNKTGIAGFLETLLRKFRTIFFIAALIPLYLLAIFAMGISLTPGIYFVHFIYNNTLNWFSPFHFVSLGIAVIAAYFIYGFTLIFVVPFFNFMMPFRIKPFRGNYFSLQSIPWFVHNAYTSIVRYSFLNFITPTPMNTLFYKMMGMKIGKDVHINTTNISDPGLIEIGDKVTIGGSAHITAHYAQKGYLVVSKTKIGERANIGLKATIMGDVHIGENAMVAPSEVILPKSRVPAGRKASIKGMTLE